MTKIICVTNHKGGVGTTASAVNIAASMGSMDHKVLLVDTDPRANSTIGMYDTPIHTTICDVFLGTNIEDVIQGSVSPGVDIIPSEFALSIVEQELIGKVSRERILQKAFKQIEGKYDYIIIDCPSVLNILSINAMTAAHKIIIPVNGIYGLDGAKNMLTTYMEIKEELNEDLERSSVFMTMYDSRTKIDKEIYGTLKELFGDKLATTKIPRNIKITEALVHHQPIISYAPKSSGAKAYQQLTKELLSKWDQE
ncbi:ParA family protein [Methanococcoides sp. SA1]|nr:ParA family protein [Methanococcoides sp. SA1]